jgi:glycosyltransferase involved in cell wall biosynthesis
MSPLHLLLVAYQCGPGMGSVSQIGWHWFTGMARRGPTTLVTHVRNRPAIEAAPDRPADAHILYIDTEWLAGPLYRLARRLFPRSEHGVFMISQLDWFAFDAAALRRLRRARREGADWSLLHLVTPVTLSAITRLHRLGLPLVRGPLNCGLPMPAGFEAMLGGDAVGLSSRLRCLPALLERLVGSLRHSAALLVATRATRQAVPAALRGRCIPMLENAVDPGCFSPDAPGLDTDTAQQRAPAPLRLAFVGRLVAVKALPLLLRAMALLRAEGRMLMLDVGGTGPMEAAWRAEAQALGLADQLCWHGALTPEGVAALMRRCDLFCLPSVRESGGAVLLEAMACARPVLAMDFGGPAEIVDSAVGWKVPMPNPERAVRALVQALREAQDEVPQRLARGQEARQRVLQAHSWDARLDAARRLYAELLAGRAPDTGFAVLPQVPRAPGL